jgi:Zn-dependent peptidase ImmA (M78 family)/transcriptional regulator with XRE-family HTH domain
MTVTHQDLANRLREAREAAGLRQEDVARHLGLSRPSVVQIESGNRAVDGLELWALARLYGRDIGDFLAAAFSAEDTVFALFRATPEIAGREVALEAIRDCVLLSRELANLEALLGLDRSQLGAPVYSVPAPRTRWQAIEQGDRAAGEERRRVGLAGRPLWDAAEFLESQGVRTAMQDLPDEVSGLTLMERGLGLSIVVNRLHHHLRRRFSWVHEYAHVLLDRTQRGTISVSSRRDDLPEVRANAFAACFLMPAEAIRSFLGELGKGSSSREHADIYDEDGTVAAELRSAPGSQTVRLYEVVLLAHHFQVSRTAALYRLHNLHILSRAQLDALLEEERADRGKRIERLLKLAVHDHAEARDEFRLRFLSLALEAYRQEKITRGKLRELGKLVGLSESDLEELIEDAGLAEEEHELLLPAELEEPW